MAEQIKLHSFRKEVDSTYVGFTPNGGSIKPVHVANGVQRCIFGGFNTAMQIKRLALVSDAKGNVPTGSELETIYAELAKNEAIEDGIAEGSVESMRNVMQRLLSADKGVYVVKGLKDDMIFIHDTNTLIEIKSTLSFSKKSTFPTVYSERAVKQLTEISRLLDEGYRACYILVSLNPSVKEITINSEIEDYYKEFMKCIEKGMTYCAFSIRLHEQTPELYAKIKITI